MGVERLGGGGGRGAGRRTKSQTESFFGIS